MTTDSIEIYIYDQNYQMICSTLGNGPTVTTTYGSLTVKPTLTANLTEINSYATVTFAI